MTGKNGDHVGTFYSCWAAASFGFMVYHLRGAEPRSRYAAGIHGFFLVIALYLTVKWMIAA